MNFIVALNEREARVVNRLVKMLRQFLNATQKPFEPIPDERLASQEDSYAIMPVPTSQSEIDAVRQVMEFTGVNELVAVLVLKSCRWSLEHAMNALFDDERRSQIETEAEKYAKAQPKPKEEAPSLPLLSVLENCPPISFLNTAFTSLPRPMLRPPKSFW